MKLVSKNQVEENVYELKITVDGEEFKAAYEESYRKNSKRLNIHGFRKGKAPRNMVMKMVGAEYFCNDAIDATYGNAYRKALDESGLTPVTQGEMEMNEVTVEGYTFTVKVTVKPEVAVKDYKGLEVKKVVAAVTDEEVEEELNRMADRNSRLVDIDDREAQEGDTANIDFEGFVDGVAFEGGKGEGYDLVLGSGQFIPGFEDQIIGKKIGEEFEVNVTFPEEYHAEELKGKPAVFKTTINSLKYKEVPEIDDEFVKDVSEFNTLDELKNDIKEGMMKRKETVSERNLEDEVCALAAEKLEVNIPHAMVENKIDYLVREFAYRLQMQGLNLQDYIKYTGSDMDSFRKGFEEQAEKQVRIELTLEQIAKEENIVPTAEEIEEEFANAAKMYGMEVEKVKEYLSEENVKETLTNNKTIDFLKANAKITEVAAEENEDAEKVTAKKATVKKATVKKTTAKKVAKEDKE